ncbi:Tetratricopeptide repeat-containing protein [Prosthecobacter debontii]|uniref:Tetratricopeptide repeat-containing protein n=1 Tax=Prosthecobacter debontii TaxID=48467 RepID=A0A1T4YC15_9BACT|nr:tetratricopeptide repeat protein [Prosthecobacter debontii]SKA99233.1 Tetratricopeptide repeat-containing protein [Prosthecobacter debontii]
MSKATPTAPVAPQAPMEEYSTPMEQFLEAHFKKLVLLCAVIAVAAVAYGVISYTNHANAVAAGEAFASAKTVEDCDLVVSQYSGTISAGNALLLKADLLWEQNKKDSSVATLREFTSQYSSHPLMAETLVALGSKLESMKEAEEARPVFERVISEFPNTDTAALAQLRLGDLLWATGKEEEAKAAYESLPAKFPNANSDFIEQSEGRLKWIAAKLPIKEVDGPPKPKAPNPASPAPGAPQLKLNTPGITPTLIPGATGAAPTIQVTPSTPEPAPLAPIELKPAPAEAPMAPLEAVPVPVPATSAPADPQVEVKPVPAPTPAAPAAPKVEVKPTPAPVPAPAPEAPKAP